MVSIMPLITITHERCKTSGAMATNKWNWLCSSDV